MILDFFRDRDGVDDSRRDLLSRAIAAGSQVSDNAYFMLGYSSDSAKEGWVLFLDLEDGSHEVVASELRRRGFFMTEPQSTGERYIIPLPGEN